MQRTGLEANFSTRSGVTVSPESQNGSPDIERILLADVECAKKHVLMTRAEHGPGGKPRSRARNSAEAHTTAGSELLMAVERLSWFRLNGSIPEDLKAKYHPDALAPA